MTFFKYHFLIIFLFSLFFTGCEIGITPLEHAANEVGIETTGAIDSDGNIGAISVVIPEGLGDFNVQIEIYGPGSEHFTVTMDKTAYGYIGEVTVKPDFIVYQDTTFNFSARTVVNGQKLCAKEIQKTVKRTEVAPVAVNKNANLNEDARTTIQLEATDKNNDPLTYRIMQVPIHGQVVLSGTSVIYTPNPDYFGTDSFTYVANDGRSDSNIATVQINVINVPEKPIDKDTIAPVITLLGVSPTSVVMGTNYYDAGATAFDETDGKVDVLLSGSVDTIKAGRYELTYTAKDLAGNISSLKRIVNVIELIVLDTVPPVITVNVGKDTIDENTAFTDAGASALDTVDGPVSVITTGSVDVTTPGTYILTYAATDRAGNTVEVERIVTVKNVNDAPTITGTPNTSVNEDSLYNFTPTGNDVDGDTLTYSISNKPSWASFDSVTGALTGTPTNTDVGIRTGIVISVSDGIVSTALPAFDITVLNKNDAPVITSTAPLTATENVPYLYTPTFTDDDISDSHTWGLSNAPIGMRVDATSGAVTWTPLEGVTTSGAVSLKITDNGSGNLSDIETFTISVTPVNDAPVAVADANTTNEDTVIIIDVLANDSDEENDTLNISAVTQGVHGVVTTDGNTVTYTPNPNFNGPDSFTYTVNDGTSDGNSVTVTMTVNPVNDVPVAGNGNLIFSETNPVQPILFDLNATDVDNNDTLTYRIVNVSDGNATVDPQTRRGIYTPPLGYSGTTSFTFEVKDESNATSYGIVNITISKLNVAPVAHDINVTLYVNETIKEISLMGSDANGDTLTYNIESVPASGEGVLSSLYQVNKTIYTREATVNTSFTYTVSDGNFTSLPATVYIFNVANTAPIAFDQNISGAMNADISISLNATDTDIGQTLTYHVLENPSYGTLTCDTNSICSYTPNANYTGNDSFIFVANDGLADSNIALVSINVGNVSNVPYLFNWCSNGDREVWQTDGTSARLLKDINDNGSSNPKDFIKIGNTYYFTAKDGDGFELWKSQGTTASTVKVKDIFKGTGDSNPEFLTNMNGILYFAAQDKEGFRQLWKSDGTTIGTEKIKTINSIGNAAPRDLTVVNNILYFTANDGIHYRELWKSDGTENGTALVDDIHNGGDSEITELTVVGNILYFVANDGIRQNNLGEIDSDYSLADLWRVDSVTGQVKRVRSFETFGKSIFTSERPPHNLFNHNGILVFNGYDDNHGKELWRSDGTLVGTIMVENFAGADVGSNPRSFINLGEDLYFIADTISYGVSILCHINLSIGESIQYWSNLGTNQVTNINNLTIFNNKVHYSQNISIYEKDNNGNVYLVDKEVNLFTGYDSLYKTLIHTSFITNYIEIQSKLLFRATGYDNNETLYITDGNNDPTILTTGCSLQ